MINSITVNGIHKPKWENELSGEIVIAIISFLNFIGFLFDKIERSQDDKLAMLDTGYITNVSGLSIQLVSRRGTPLELVIIWGGKI